MQRPWSLEALDLKSNTIIELIRYVLEIVCASFRNRIFHTRDFVSFSNTGDKIKIKILPVGFEPDVWTLFFRRAIYVGLSYIETTDDGELVKFMFLFFFSFNNYRQA